MVSRLSPSIKCYTDSRLLYADDIDILSDSDEKVDFDPYKGIDMSKDRIKTVVELEQVPRTITIKLNGKEHNVQQMTQGQWMQGCPEGSEQSVSIILLL